MTEISDRRIDELIGQIAGLRGDLQRIGASESPTVFVPSGVVNQETLGVAEQIIASNPARYEVYIYNAGSTTVGICSSAGQAVGATLSNPPAGKFWPLASGNDIKLRVKSSLWAINLSSTTLFSISVAEAVFATGEGRGTATTEILQGAPHVPKHVNDTAPASRWTPAPSIKAPIANGRR